MDKFWVVTLFHLQPTGTEWSRMEKWALEDHQCQGIEEFSLDEPEVDALLGERSYSGGDLPMEVLEEVEEALRRRPATFRFFFSDPGMAEGFLVKVRKETLCESQLEEQEVKDWNAEWKKHYAPIKINDQLTIVPAWERGYQSQTKEVIFINPGMGFGTGSHETTYLCLKLFTENVLASPVKNVLDFGSGSGILGLAAMKFFPEARVDFYDIDPEANKNCYHNAEINHLTQHAFRLLLPEVRSKLQPQYELIFANILENILVQERDALVRMCPQNGWLILSGLLNHQARTIIDLYSKDLTLVRELKKGDWSALLMRKN